MRPRLTLRTVMAIVAGCAVVLAIPRTDLWDKWDESLREAASLGLYLWDKWDAYLRRAARTGLVLGGLCTLVSFLLLWIVARDAPWRRKAGRDPGTEPHFWAWAWRTSSRWAIRSYARWPALWKHAFWSCGTALCLVLLLDQASGGVLGNSGAPGEIGWPAYTLLVAGVILVIRVAWTWLGLLEAKDALARRERKWRHGRVMTSLCAAIRFTLTWLLITSPAWFRILLAWLLAELSVPVARLVVIGVFHVDRDTNSAMIAPRFLAVLIVWLLVCGAILVRGLYDMSRNFFPRPMAILLGIVLSAAHVWSFFRVL